MLIINSCIIFNECNMCMNHVKQKALDRVSLVCSSASEGRAAQGNGCQWWTEQEVAGEGFGYLT